METYRLSYKRLDFLTNRISSLSEKDLHVKDSQFNDHIYLFYIVQPNASNRGKGLTQRLPTAGYMPVTTMGAR